ncbi:MAG: CRISPR-associated protein Cas5 [Dissulfuribacterales bacterium]
MTENNKTFCVVELFTQTATFRNPDFQNFHKSFILPPPTTLIGVAGAALGFGPKTSQDFFSSDNWLFGVFGKSQGKSNDLWKFRKKKGSTFTEDLLIKEFLYDNTFYLVYGNDDQNKIHQLVESFKNPKFALTLGNSDSLAKVIKVDLVKKVTSCSQITNCMVEGDIIDNVIQNAQNGLNFSIYTTSDPVAYDLPTSFDYAKEYGERKISARKTFSFVGEEMTLNFDLKGIMYNNNFIPLFDLKNA